MQTVLIVLLFTWLSTATILLPLPWLLDPSFATTGVWIQWLAKLSLVTAGVFLCAIALRRKGKWRMVAASMSAVYLAYWASEYLLAIRPAADTFASVLHAIMDLDGMPRLVLVQLHLVLPIIHLVALLYLVLTHEPKRTAD